MIQAEHVSFSYPGSYDNVFDDISFQIDTDWKLGLIGRNGRGKTTLLCLLQKQYEYEGSISSSVAFDYFPYDVRDQDRETSQVFNEICPDAEEWEFLRELSYLQVSPDVLFRPFATLSQGERTKVLLAALFLNEEHFLLIDEPTNHLDRSARRIVSDYLNRKKGFILVSHDREFLDGCVDHILSINRASIEVRSGTFSTWMENFQHRQNFEEAKNERLQKEVKRLQRASKRTAVWSDRVEAKKNVRNSGSKVDKGYIGHKSAKMMKRAKNLEENQQRALEETSGLLNDRERKESLIIRPQVYHTDLLAQFTDVSVCYGEHFICEGLSFSVRTGDRIAINGTNGSGKSSLLKLLIGEPIAHTGTVSVGSGLRISYVSQDTSDLHGTLAQYAEKHGIDESLLKTILRKMDFERIQFEKDSFDFSQGQKKKVLLARSLCERAHLYVWDEPLNYIDVYSRIQMEELIKEFEPTMVFVEHDAKFQEHIATGAVNL